MNKGKRRTVRAIDRASLVPGGSRRESGSAAGRSSARSRDQKSRLSKLLATGIPWRRRPAEPLLPVDKVPLSAGAWMWGLVLVAALLFAYFPTLQWLEQTWRNEADYSHGYLVFPLAVVLLWMRWGSFPGLRPSADWNGLWLIGLSLAMRVLGRLAYMDFMDGWSLVPFVAGMVWLLFGWSAMRWAAPAIVFLIMLVPLPYRAETLLSWKLQGAATVLSTGLLRILGQPAIAQGHTIWIGESQLLIEEACSGLRIFVGVFALAYFWAVTQGRGWLDRVVIIIAAAPMALVVNALRITATGVLYQWFGSASARVTIHDVLGYLMIPTAAALMWLVSVYWHRLYRPVAVYNPSDRLRGSPQPR